MIETEVRVINEGMVRVIVLDRPGSKNGLTLPVVERLRDLIRQASEDPSVRVIGVSGIPGSFCSGLDLKEGANDLETYGGMRNALDQLYHGLIKAIVEAPKPVVALVDGTAAGFGADVAFACDLRLCSTRAKFSERFGRIGLIPDGGGTYSLARLIGTGRALELIFTAEVITAERAKEIGIANHVYAEAAFAERSGEFLQRLSKGAPLAMAAAKRLVRTAQSTTLSQALAAEADAQEKLLESNDFMRGVGAFMMKTDPEFEGN
jgi:2-(1,2-epoxy-1,2-dihydrophenyl)acetyl-CoA isomerase